MSPSHPSLRFRAFPSQGELGRQQPLGLRALLDDLLQELSSSMTFHISPVNKRRGTLGTGTLGSSICSRDPSAAPRTGPLGDRQSQAQALPQLGPVLALGLGS